MWIGSSASSSSTTRVPPARWVPVRCRVAPRAEIVWLDESDTLEVALKCIADSGHTRFPVCRGSLDDVRGLLNAASLLQPLARGDRPLLGEHLEAAIFVPETLSGMELLENFRAADTDLVFVVDEYGAVQGVITERDLLEAITGEFGAPTDEDAWAVQRPDGGWLMDGLIPVPELKDRLELKDLPEEDRGRYNTLAGMIMLLSVSYTHLWWRKGGCSNPGVSCKRKRLGGFYVG